MKELQVGAKNGQYKITISSGIIKAVGQEAAALVSGRRAVVVSDENVAGLYMDTVVTSLENAGFQAFSCVIPKGEASKSQKYLFLLYDRFHEAGITRSDIIIALGGGVVGDLSGFAASTWLRGCGLMQVPTTLLSQVDSSVGGKTAIDMPYGKNLVGSFYAPHRVLIDPDTLKTLPPNRFAEGMAEIIKHGAIRSEALFCELEKGEYDLSEVIYQNIAIKCSVVEKDEFDKGERMILNFGHTLGHAVEKLNGFREMSHGEAVSIGMIYASLIGEALSITPAGTTERLSQLLKRNHLPVRTDLGAEEIFSCMISDKKNLGGKIHYVLLTEIGKAVTYPLSLEELQGLLHSAMKREIQ